MGLRKPPRRITRPGWLKQEAPKERLASGIPSLRLQVPTAPSHRFLFGDPGQKGRHRSRPLIRRQTLAQRRKRYSSTPRKLKAPAKAEESCSCAPRRRP